MRLTCCSYHQAEHLLHARYICCKTCCADAELSQKVVDVEAAAVYSDAKAKHEKNMARINGAIAEVQQDVQQMNACIKGQSAGSLCASFTGCISLTFISATSTYCS